MDFTHKKNEYVVYKKRGIYRIEEIKQEKIESELRFYYVLKSVYDANSSVYVPVDSETLIAQMEKVLSKEEIEVIINNSANAEIEYKNEANLRQEYYDEIFQSENLSRIIALMKVLAQRKSDALITKGKVPAMDERALGNCQRILSEAFAFSLGLSKGEIAEYILSKIK